MNMHRVYVALAVSLLCFGAAREPTVAQVNLPNATAQSSTVTPKDITLPERLLVEVVFDKAVSSGVDVVDDSFSVHAAKDVVVDGYVIIKAGAVGEGRVVAATPALRTEPGSLSYDIDYVTGIDGKKIRLTATKRVAQNVSALEGTDRDLSNDAKQNAATGAAANAATGVAVDAVKGVPGGPTFLQGVDLPGIFSHTKKAREAVIPVNTTVRSYVAATVHTISSTLAPNATPAPLRPPGDDGFAH